MSNFITALEKSAKEALPNVSVTENGAVGLATSGKKLVDLNFMLSSMRDMGENEIWTRFLEVYNENPTLATVWLFFSRDIRGGAGERRIFRTIFPRLARENRNAAMNLLPLIPEYGRWDDLVEIACSDTDAQVRTRALSIIEGQFRTDLANATVGKPVSLLSKWLSSENTSSKETKRKAKIIREAFGMTPKYYRKALAHLRRHLKVTEVAMSANQWETINYSAVPSRAAMNYRDAFDRHDQDRYRAYLEAVKSGNEKINAGTLFPHDIVCAYHHGDWGFNTFNATLEAQWKALPNTVPPDAGTLVVVDGSGSMITSIGKSSVMCLDVAQALGLYFAERLNGAFKDYFITFSANPRLVHVDPRLSLQGKLQLISNYTECSNTNIEKTFDLILDTAVKNHMKQSDLPANVLIISDQEFDSATEQGDWRHPLRPSKKLFDVIAAKYESLGYKLPRLVFWNVCSRTGTIPLAENDYGVALVSGFSTSIADMVMSGKLDPFECLVDKLTSDRYKPVFDALKE